LIRVRQAGASFLHDMQKHDPSSQVESLRFRSTAFASSVGPKKAAFAKKELMDDTTSSTQRVDMVKKCVDSI
jgi:hypothetical protein